MIPVEHGQTCIFVIFSLFVIVLSDFTISLLFFVCVFFLDGVGGENACC